MKRIEILTNDRGTILVISLIIMALASMIGVAALTTASLEIQVSGNDMRYAESFYKADAAAMAGASAIEGSVPTVLLNRKFKAQGETGDEITLATEAQLPDSDDIENDGNWATDADISAEAPSAISDDGYNARFLPVEMPARGTSLDLAGTSGTKMHEFIIYGRSVFEPGDSNKRLGQTIVEIGYKKRF
jgi:hypothetical protein